MFIIPDFLGICMFARAIVHQFSAVFTQNLSFTINQSTLIFFCSQDLYAMMDLKKRKISQVITSLHGGIAISLSIGGC